MRRKWSPLSVFLVSASLVVLVVVFAPFDDGRRRPRSLCLSNVKQLATAVLIYVEDHDQRFPLENWADATQAIRKKDDMLHCPENEGRGGYGYAMNSAVVGKQYNLDMDWTVLFFETEVQARNLIMNLAGRSDDKHAGQYSAVSFCNGAARYVKKGQRPDSRPSL